MKLSIVIPAFNEEELLPRCLASVCAATRAAANEHSGWAFETVVCDNNSKDRTGEIAREHGAKVVFEPVNQIARARNRGASIASGDWILFIDADSELDSAVLCEVIAKIQQGRYVGGGCLIGLDHMPWWGYPAQAIWNTISWTMGWAAGSFIFCRSDAFREIEGFDEARFAAEEVDFCQRLKYWGRRSESAASSLKFVILTNHRHISSGRKFHLYSGYEILKLALQLTILHPWAIRRKASLDYFYDGRR